MHGGAAGSGGQPGNRNALKHGAYSAEAVQQRRQVRALIEEVRAMLKTL